MGILDGGLSFDGVDESSTGDYSPVPDGQYSIEAVSCEVLALMWTLCLSTSRR